MNAKELQSRNLITEARFQTSRSGGSGGQNVNKVETRVELFFNVNESTLLSAEEKLLLAEKLKNKISNEGILKLYTDTDRSQLKNKAIIIKRFYDLLSKTLTVNKARKATKPSKSVIKKRLKEKQGKQRKQKADCLVIPIIQNK